MAIDTQNKRASVLGLALASQVCLPAPGTALALLGTRQHLAGLYAGIVTFELLELTFTPELETRYTIPLPPHSMRQIPLNTDALVRIRGAKVFDPVTGTRIPATGITLSARVALTPTGAAVHASLALDLTERAAGDFYGTIDGAALETHLRAHLGEVVYLVFSVGAGDYVGHRAVRVIDGVTHP